MGIGAGDMGLFDEFCGNRLGYTGETDIQCYSDAETLLVGAGAEAHMRGDGRVRGNRDGFLLFGADILDRAQETGGIGRGKQLVGVEAIIGATHLLRLADLDVEHAIGGFGLALPASSG